MNQHRIVELDGFCKNPIDIKIHVSILPMYTGQCQVFEQSFGWISRNGFKYNGLELGNYIRVSQFGICELRISLFINVIWKKLDVTGKDISESVYFLAHGHTVYLCYSWSLSNINSKTNLGFW